MSIEKELKIFYKRFNLKPEEFYSRYSSDFESSGKSFRESILMSELKDFEKLSSTIGEIDEIQKKLLDRYKIEQRNSFSPEITSTYVRLLISIHDLKDLLETQQIPFYAKRIKILKDELGEIEE